MSVGRHHARGCCTGKWRGCSHGRVHDHRHASITSAPGHSTGAAANSCISAGRCAGTRAAGSFTTCGGATTTDACTWQLRARLFETPELLRQVAHERPLLHSGALGGIQPIDHTRRLAIADLPVARLGARPANHTPLLLKGASPRGEPQRPSRSDISARHLQHLIFSTARESPKATIHIMRRPQLNTQISGTALRQLFVRR